MQPLSSAGRRVAGWCHFHRTANIAARSFFQRILSGSVSQHGPGVGRRFWRLDALVLCRSDVGSEFLAWKTRVTSRPNLLAGEEFPPDPQQKRSLEKRAQLKAAALALFAEKGFERTSIEDIANRANLAVGGFYLHYRSKRQLLLVLMDDLLKGLDGIDLRPEVGTDVQTVLRDLLGRAFARDLHYLGACRAWEEAVLSDPDLARKQQQIRSWTTQRVTTLFALLRKLPGARPGVDFPALARVMDGFFWSLLAQAVRMPKVELNDWIDSATHLIYHALFADQTKRVSRKKA
jgi:AcrR family transcriptional regulator